MFDEVARRSAADLVERLRDGSISNFDFEESWPLYDRRDRALSAIETMLWRFYDDGFEHKLTDEGRLLNSEGHDVFSRVLRFCAAILNMNGLMIILPASVALDFQVESCLSVCPSSLKGGCKDARYKRFQT